MNRLFCSRSLFCQSQDDEGGSGGSYNDDLDAALDSALGGAEPAGGGSDPDPDPEGDAEPGGGEEPAGDEGSEDDDDDDVDASAGGKPAARPGAKPVAKDGAKSGASGEPTIRYGGYALTERQVSQHFDDLLAKQTHYSKAAQEATGKAKALEARIAELEAEMAERPDPDDGDPTAKRIRTLEKQQKKLEAEKTASETRAREASFLNEAHQTISGAVAQAVQQNPELADLPENVRSSVMKAIRFDLEDLRRENPNIDIPRSQIRAVVQQTLAGIDGYAAGRVKKTLAKMTKNRGMAHEGAGSRAGGGRGGMAPKPDKRDRVPSFKHSSNDLSNIIDSAFDQAFASVE